MIDTHAHLNLPSYQKDLKRVIRTAIQNKVNKIICVSSNIFDSKKSIQIAREYPGIIYATVGIHPHKTDPKNYLSYKQKIEILIKLTREKEVVAIGECGLDFSQTTAETENRSLEEQIFLFQKQIEIAQKFNLPIIIHSRKAFLDTIEILSSYKNLTGVFHCYSAGKRGIKEVLNLGFYFGVDGNLTYDFGLQHIFSQIPVSKIFLETDSPFLSPYPYRHKRNEPSFLVYTAQKLAEIKKLTLKEIDQITTQNTINTFSL